MFALVRSLAYIAFSAAVVMAGILFMITGGPPTQSEIALAKSWLDKAYVAALDGVASGAAALRDEYCAKPDDRPPAEHPCA